jgi:hypothetical protein
MSLIISNAQLSPEVQVHRWFGGAPWLNVSTSAPDERSTSLWTVLHADILAGMANTMSFILAGPTMSLGQAFHLRGYVDDIVENTILSYPPRDFHDDYVYDHSTYGNVFHEAYQNLLRVSSENGVVYPSQENENYVRHFGFKGNLRSKLSVMPMVSGGNILHLSGGVSSSNGVYMPFFPGYQNEKANAVIQSLNPLTLTFNSTSTGSVRPRFVDFLDYLKSGWYSTCNGPNDSNFAVINHSWDTTISKLGYTHFSNGDVSVSYHVVARNLTTGSKWEWDSSWKFSSKFTYSLTTPTVGAAIVTHNGWTLGTTAKLTVSNYRCLANNVRPTPSSFTREALLFTREILLDVPVNFTQATFGKVWSNGVSVHPMFDTIRDNFSRSVSDNWSHVTPSSAFSSVDALGSMESSVGNNVLQTLVKVPDIASALPRLEEAISVLGKLVRRDLSFSTFREILDLATSTHLQVSFQWRPYYELLTKYLPEIVSMFPMLLSPKKLALGYGSFSYNFSNEFGRKSVSLVTRTKVVADVTLNGLLSPVLSLDAMGLLPTFSRGWDLVPFSFAVNWFTGWNRILRNLELIGASSLIPIAYVHSYLLTSPLTTAELDAVSASSTGILPAQVRVYIRDKTLYPPFPKYSRFPFGVPATFPSLGLVGSLLYQLFLKG